MATGNPLLAVLFEDGYVRTYEWVPTNSKFVQMAARSGYVQSLDQQEYAPQIFWGDDGRVVAVVWSYTDIIGRLSVLDPVLEPLEEFEFGSGYGGVPALFTTDNAVNTNLLYQGFDIGRWGLIYRVTDISPFIEVVNNIPDDAPAEVYHDNLTSVAVTPDGSVYVFGRKRPGVTYSYPRASNNPPVFPYDNRSSLDTFINPDLLKFSKDGRFLAVVDKTGLAEIWVNSGGALSIQQQVPLPAGNPVAVAFSNDKRHLAISCVSGGDYITRTYFRQGAYFALEQTIPDFGGLLEFSHDGMMLIDAKTRRAFSLDTPGFNSWSEIVDALEDVSSSAVGQSVSPHSLQPITMAYIYDHVINRFKNDLVDLNNMHLTLLKDTAVFNRTHTTFLQATNNWVDAVSDGGFPAEGVLLTFDAETDLGPRYVYTVEDPSRDIVVDPLVARYALLHEGIDPSGQPLVFYDLGAERSIPRYTKLTLDFRNDELLTFSS